MGEALENRALADGPPVVLEIEDAFCPWNAGRWHVESGNVGRTDEDADLRLDVSGLGSVYLGAVSFAELRDALRIEELQPGAVERADAMFAWRPLPWCPEIF